METEKKKKADWSCSSAPGCSELIETWVNNA